MTAETKLSVAAALKKYKEDKNLSNDQLAIEIGGGLSGASVSNICNGKEQYMTDKMMRKISAFLKTDMWNPIETDNVAAINEMCEEAQMFSRFFSIIGRSGLGKTTGLETYQAQHTNTYYVLSNILMSGTRNFLKAIQKAMGINTGKTPADLMDAIVHRLSIVGKPLLIIDDAGKLNETNLRLIQLLYDRTKGHCGIIIAGTPFLKDSLETGTTKGKMGFDELTRRIEYWHTLNGPTRPEVASIALANGVHPQKYPSVITWIANTSGNFGTVTAKLLVALRLQDEGRLNQEALARAFSSSPKSITAHNESADQVEAA